MQKVEPRRYQDGPTAPWAALSATVTTGALSDWWGRPAPPGAPGGQYPEPDIAPQTAAG